MLLIDEDKLYALLGATAKYAYNKGFKDGLTDAKEFVQGNPCPAHYDPDGMEAKIQEVVREAREEVLRG